MGKCTKKLSSRECDAMLRWIDVFIPWKGGMFAKGANRQQWSAIFVCVAVCRSYFAQSTPIRSQWLMQFANWNENESLYKVETPSSYRCSECLDEIEKHKLYETEFISFKRIMQEFPSHRATNLHEMPFFTQVLILSDWDKTDCVICERIAAQLFVSYIVSEAT